MTSNASSSRRQLPSVDEPGEVDTTLYGRVQPAQPANDADTAAPQAASDVAVETAPAAPGPAPSEAVATVAPAPAPSVSAPGPAAARTSPASWLALATAAAALVVSLSSVNFKAGVPNGLAGQSIARLETEAKALSMRQQRVAATASLTAARSLQVAILQGGSFATELAVMKALGGPPETIGALAVLEKQVAGVPTIGRLLSDFEQAAALALLAENTPADAGWMGQTLARVSAITVAVGMELNVNPLNSGVAPVILAGDGFIRQEALPQALRTLDDMTPEQRQLFTGWANATKARLAALAATSVIVDQALRGVATAGS